MGPLDLSGYTNSSSPIARCDEPRAASEWIPEPLRAKQQARKTKPAGAAEQECQVLAYCPALFRKLELSVADLQRHAMGLATTKAGRKRTKGEEEVPQARRQVFGRVTKSAR